MKSLWMDTWKTRLTECELPQCSLDRFICMPYEKSGRFCTCIFSLLSVVSFVPRATRKCSQTTQNSLKWLATTWVNSELSANLRTEYHTSRARTQNSHSGKGLAKLQISNTGFCDVGSHFLSCETYIKIVHTPYWWLASKIKIVTIQ